MGLSLCLCEMICIRVYQKFPELHSWVFPSSVSTAGCLSLFGCMSACVIMFCFKIQQSSRSFASLKASLAVKILSCFPQVFILFCFVFKVQSSSLKPIPQTLCQDVKFLSDIDVPKCKVATTVLVQPYFPFMEILTQADNLRAGEHICRWCLFVCLFCEIVPFLFFSILFFFSSFPFLSSSFLFFSGSDSLQKNFFFFFNEFSEGEQEMKREEWLNISASVLTTAALKCSVY